MKKKTTIFLAAALVLLLAAAAFLYPRLAERYTADQSFAGGASSEASSPASSSAEGSTPEKIPAPDFTVLDPEGKSVSLSNFLGKPIVINFWATWCGPCKSELPAFQKIYESYGEDITFLMVNMTDGRDTEEVVKEFMADNSYTFPVYFDTKQDAATAYGAYSIPATVFIDTEGMVVDAYLGALSEKTLTACMEKLLEGR